MTIIIIIIIIPTNILGNILTGPFDSNRESKNPKKQELPQRIETQNIRNRNNTRQHNKKKKKIPKAKRKKKCGVNQENHDWKEDHISISQEPRQENRHVETEKY